MRAYANGKDKGRPVSHILAALSRVGKVSVDNQTNITRTIIQMNSHKQFIWTSDLKT